MAANLRLRPLRPEDEGPGRAAHEELADYAFFLDYDRHEPWIQFVERTQRQRGGIDVAPDRVRAAFLVAWVGEEIVGRASIRIERCGGEYEDTVHDPREEVEKIRYRIR